MKPRWWATGCSTVGANHSRLGLPNQDALALQTEALIAGGSNLTWAFVAVADGHGAERYFRSERGAVFGVNAAANALQEMVTLLPRTIVDGVDLQNCRMLFKQQLPQLIVKKWIDYVEKDIASNPYNDQEALIVSSGQRSDIRMQHNRPTPSSPNRLEPRLRPYGAALGFAVVSDAYIAFASLGDIDVVTVTAEGSALRALAASNEVGEATHSLCLPDAPSLFQAEFVALSPDNHPSMIFIGTDGFSKSFASESDFLSTCEAYAQNAKDEGHRSLDLGLLAWLEETTLHGSGDDVTVGLIFDLSVSKTPGEAVLEDDDLVELVSDSANGRAVASNPVGNQCDAIQDSVSDFEGATSSEAIETSIDSREPHLGTDSSEPVTRAPNLGDLDDIWIPKE